MKPGFTLVIAALALLAGCAPDAPKGVDKDRLDEAVSRAIGDPATCLLIAEQDSGRLVYRYNTHITCGRTLPACEGSGTQLLDQLLQATRAASAAQLKLQSLARLRRLMAHTAQHFHDEEALLARVDFPGHSFHAAEHQRLLEKASRFEAEVSSGKTDMSQFVGFLILDLVQGHIVIEDRNYFSYFQSAAARNPSPQSGPPFERTRIW